LAFLGLDTRFYMILYNPLNGSVSMGRRKQRFSIPSPKPGFRNVKTATGYEQRPIGGNQIVPSPVIPGIPKTSTTHRFNRVSVGRAAVLFGRGMTRAQVLNHYFTKYARIWGITDQTEMYHYLLCDRPYDSTF
jgi:hypothetical protein